MSCRKGLERGSSPLHTDISVFTEESIQYGTNVHRTKRRVQVFSAKAFLSNITLHMTTMHIRAFHRQEDLFKEFNLKVWYTFLAVKRCTKDTYKYRADNTDAAVQDPFSTPCMQPQMTFFINVAQQQEYLIETQLYTDPPVGEGLWLLR